MRKWPDENYVTLARRLLVEFPDANVAFTGARPEAADVARLVGRIDSPRCHSIAGQTTLRQLLAGTIQ